MEAAWGLMVNIKEIIVELLDSDNDGIRTMAVKFMEMLVLTQTHRSAGHSGYGYGFQLEFKIQLLRKIF